LDRTYNARHVSRSPCRLSATRGRAVSAFLTRLTALATGSAMAAAARIALPSRFAPRSSALPDGVMAEIDGLDTVANAVAVPRPASETGETFVFDAMPSPENMQQSVLQTGRSTKPMTGAPQPAQRGEPIGITNSARTGDPGASRIRAPRDSAHHDSAIAAPFGHALEGPLHVLAPLRPAIAARESTQDRTAPLTADALAERTQSPRSAPPIHVTIDRIDVRAAVPPKTATPQTRARRGPSQSLAEYLHGPERGGRS
jgi:hypothetical protein